MKLPSIKKRIIFSLAFAPNLDELKGHEVFLVTGSGMVRGYPVNIENPGLLAQVAKTIADEHLKDSEFPQEIVMPGSDGYLVLRDVQVKEGANTYNFDELIVFYDQIIGIGLGKPVEED